MKKQQTEGYPIAAWMAAFHGDLVNAAIAATPGGIERQEAEGQRSLTNGARLPKECAYCTREQLEQMGIRFGEDADDLFVNVELPVGWSVKPTDHSMWSDLVDAHGYKRAAIFYKAAFYDRDAHISLNSRYSATIEPANGYEQDYDYQTTDWVGLIRDHATNAVLWRSDARSPQGGKPWETRDQLSKESESKLAEMFPSYRDPLAYWDN